MMRALVAVALLTCIAARCIALPYHATMDHVPDVRETYIIIYAERQLTSASAECRLLTQRSPDIDPSGMIVAGPTLVGIDRVAITFLPGQSRRGNVYWCRVRGVDADGNTPTAEIRIYITEPR